MTDLDENKTDEFEHQEIIDFLMQSDTDKNDAKVVPQEKV